jgi:toxin ParE1/3/4
VTHRVEYTETAREDLYRIGDYLRENAGDETAERFIRRLIAKADSLSFMPERYREREELQPGLRAVLVEKYLLFYRVDNRTVSIIRVLHGARDIAAEMVTP